MSRDIEIRKIKIVQRLRKVEGQIRGIQSMILANRSYDDIIMQMTAVKSALNKINKLILEENLNHCFQYSDDLTFTQDTMDEIIDLIHKFLGQNKDF